jgi:hypothetical protein
LELAKVCEVCEAELEENCFARRWKDAKILVIGAAYNHEDLQFWSKLDENYIGIGMGAHIFQSEPHWQTNWNAPRFWTHTRPYKDKGFKYVFLDRCVWNVVMQNFGPVLTFARDVLQDNGCLLIPKTNWKPASEIYIKHQFIAHAKSQFLRSIENEYDTEAVLTLVRDGHFMMAKGYTEFYSADTEGAHDRHKWKAFMKMKLTIVRD